jgi:hypothetical protein
MTPQTATADRAKQHLTVEQKIQKMRELYADAPELGRAALENGLSVLTEALAAPPRNLWLSNCEGYPGMRSVQAAKEWIFQHQIAADAWYVNSPNLTAPETRRLDNIGGAVEEVLDKIA